MPANVKGGKQYKKKAKGSNDEKVINIERGEDQQIARVIKILGNRFMSCYCNDSTIRVCRVRGKMRGREFVEKGDVVLISLRDFETGEKDDKSGDILARYPHDSLSALKKEEGINQKLFLQLELLDGSRLSQIGEHEQTWEFEHDNSDSESADEKAVERVVAVKQEVIDIDNEELMDIDSI